MKLSQFLKLLPSRQAKNIRKSQKEGFEIVNITCSYVPRADKLAMQFVVIMHKQQTKKIAVEPDGIYNDD